VGGNLIVAMAPMTACAIIGVFLFGRFSHNIKLLVRYLIYVFLQQVIALYLGLKFNQNSPVYHIFLIITVYAFWRILSAFIQSKRQKKILKFVAWAVISIQILSIFFVQSILEFPTFNYGLTGLYVTFGCISYFADLIERPSESRLFLDSKFWTIAAFMIFYAPTFFIMLSFNFVQNHGGSLFTFLDVIFVFNFLFYALLAGALFLDIKMHSVRNV
jgi:hypothetical protein